MLGAALDMSGFFEARDRTIRELTDGLAHMTESAAREGAAEAKAVGRFKDRTGDLRGHIRPELVSEDARRAYWKIVSPEPYSIFVESPTKAHRIEARNAAVLRWVDGSGQVRFAKGVNHPGTPGFPFMGPAALKAERVLYRETTLMVQRMGKIWVG